MLALAGCHESLDQDDGIFSKGKQNVYCAADLDDIAGNDLPSIHAGLERAARDGEQIHLYAHVIGETVPTAKIEAVLDDIEALGLPYVTYRDLAGGASPGAAVVLSFDDTRVDTWYAAQPMFAAHAARLTFFVTRYYEYDATARMQLHELNALGHDVEAHTITHQRAPDYVEDHGLQAWLDDEALPSISVLTDDGFAPSVAFAYPFGARTDQTDDAMLAHVGVLRSVSFAYSAPVDDPCPN